jgi:hypothetical protein
VGIDPTLIEADFHRTYYGYMNQKTFVRKVSGSLTHYAWFLGAGTSQSAGLPTASDIIWDLKKRYYCVEENQRLSDQDVQNPAVREKISSFAEARGLPKSGTADEYAKYFELSFGSDKEAQRKYVREALAEEKVSLAMGHRVLAAFIASGNTRIVFTTNFDNVIEMAMARVAGKDLHAFHLEGSHAAVAALNNEEFPIYCKLHGDFRYESLKNLPTDTQHQDAELRKCVDAASIRFGLIVVGYSGRDQSVMDLLRNACANTNAFPHGVYWLVLKNKHPLPAVTEFIKAARAKGITAEIVEIETFDSALSRLWRQLPSIDPALDAKVRRASNQEVTIPLPENGTKAPILRTNALPIVRMPSKCLCLVFDKVMSWDELRAFAIRAGDGLAFTKQDAVFAWGERNTIRTVFGSELRDIQEIEISNRLGNLTENMSFKSMLVRAISLALKRRKPLIYRSVKGRSYLIADNHATDQSIFRGLTEHVGKVHGMVSGLFTTATEEHPEKQQIAWAEAVEISVEEREGRLWLLVQPNIWIWPKHGRRDAAQLLDTRRGNRFNAQSDKILSAWLTILLPSDEKNADVLLQPFENGTEAENPKIVVNNRTAFSRRLG